MNLIGYRLTHVWQDVALPSLEGCGRMRGVEAEVTAELGGSGGRGGGRVGGLGGLEGELGGPRGWKRVQGMDWGGIQGGFFGAWGLPPGEHNTKAA